VLVGIIELVVGPVPKGLFYESDFWGMEPSISACASALVIMSNKQELKGQRLEERCYRNP
jgi:hypothetical protein